LFFVALFPRHHDADAYVAGLALGIWIVVTTGMGSASWRSAWDTNACARACALTPMWIDRVTGAILACARFGMLVAQLCVSWQAPTHHSAVE